MNESPSLPKGVKDPLAKSHVGGGLSNGVPGKRMAPQPPTNGSKNGPLASLAFSMPPCTPSTWASPHSFVLSSSPGPNDGTRPMVNGTNGSPSTNWILSNMRHDQHWNGTVKRSPHQPSPSLDSPCSTPKQTRVLSSLLNDTSQGSCDTTPATPDSLIGSSSLICSDEDGNNSHNTTVLQARQQTASSSGIHLSCSPSSSLTSPPFELTSTASVWRGSNSNLSSQQQRDNLIEEVTTPVPMCSNNDNNNGSTHGNGSHNNNFLISCSSSSAPSSPSTSSRAGSLSSPASPMSPFRPFHHDTGTIKRNGGTLVRPPSKHQAPPAKMYVSLYPEMSVPAAYGRTNGLREAPPLDRESLIKRSNSNQHMNGNQAGSTSSINYHHHYRHVPPEFVCAQQKKTGTHHNERKGGGSNVCHYATIQRRSHGQNNVCGTFSSTNNSLMQEQQQQPPVSSNGCGGSSSLASRSTTNTCNRLPSTRSQDLPLSDVRTLASSVSIEGQGNSNNSVPSFSARTSNNDLHLTIQALQQHQLLTQKKAQVNCRGQRDKFSQPRGFNSNQSRSRSTSSTSSSSTSSNSSGDGSESDTDKDVYALEEKIRKQSSFPSLFQSRPFKKPPFTIESAMSAVYQKKQKNKKKHSKSSDVSKTNNHLTLSSPFSHRDDGQSNSNHHTSNTSSKASLQNNADLQDSSLISVAQIQSIQQDLINQHSIATLGPSEPSEPPPLLPTSVSSNQEGKSRGKRPRKDVRAGSNHSLIPGDLTALSSTTTTTTTTTIPQSQEEVRGAKRGQGSSKAPVSANHVSSILARLKISGDPVNGREGLIQDQPASMHPTYHQAALERKEKLDEIKSLEESDPMLIDSNLSMSPHASSPLPPPLPAKNATTLSTIAQVIQACDLNCIWLLMTPILFQVNSQDIKGNGHVLRRSMDREAQIPLISKEPSPFSAGEDDLNEETETGDDTDHRKRRKRRHLRRKNGEKERQKDKLDPNGIDPDDDGRNDNEDLVENEMEYCDPCYCYGKCCLDVVASIFCVSLLWEWIWSRIRFSKIDKKTNSDQIKATFATRGPWSSCYSCLKPGMTILGMTTVPFFKDNNPRKKK